MKVQTSSGTNGAVGTIALPAEITMKITLMGVVRPDDTHVQRRGIVPDVHVSGRLPEDIASKTDRIFNTALDLVGVRRSELADDPNNHDLRWTTRLSEC
jgi:C-terminal processing protease CtpA/Prc